MTIDVWTSANVSSPNFYMQCRFGFYFLKFHNKVAYWRLKYKFKPYSCMPLEDYSFVQSNSNFIKSVPAPLPLFHFFRFKQTIPFLQQINLKNIHPVASTGNQTHDLWNKLPPMTTISNIRNRRLRLLLPGFWSGRFLKSFLSEPLRSISEKTFA